MTYGILEGHLRSNKLLISPDGFAPKLSFLLDFRCKLSTLGAEPTLDVKPLPTLSINS